MEPEPLTDTPPHPVRRAVFNQQWRDLTMLHWPVPAEAVAPLLPPGTGPDLHDGVTWVGLVPFVMRDIGVLGTPPVPGLSSFAETNVRLYAVDGTGRRGVVFRSLEAARLLPVLVARAVYRLPYQWARMRVARSADTITYTTARRWPGPRGAGGTVSVEIGPEQPADALTTFLTARWGLYSSLGRRTLWAPMEHPPWMLHAARLLSLSDDLVRAAGLEVVGAPHVLFSPGVDVRAGRPSGVRQRL